MMEIRKRSGEDVPFDITKIEKAIEKANHSVAKDQRMTAEEISQVAKTITEGCEKLDSVITVETVQDAVIFAIMQAGHYQLANNYITYRYQHELQRKTSNLDQTIFNIVDSKSAAVKEENSNKNTDIIPTQRDYIAGEASKDLTRRYKLPPDIMMAHDDGMIHFHDMDYFIQHSHNCCLVNVKDMLDNGTCITGTMIESPHRFLTAANITTQISAQVASNQYGGQSISIAHLAPYINKSRLLIREKVVKEVDEGIANGEINVEIGSEGYYKYIDRTTERRVRDEVRDGVQTIQYQVLTLMTTNGQTPFITLFLYLNEVGDDPILKKDMALLIEEVLLQRIQGVKNEVGAYVSPAFPKLVYVTEDDNIYNDSPYLYLTWLACQCSAKRLTPDYISERKMKELKGDVYPCMGCVEGNEIITYRYKGNLFVESFKRAWNRLSNNFEIQIQPGRTYDKYMDLQDVEIYDSNINGFTECKRIIRNISSEWIDLSLSNGRHLRCTVDHPITTATGETKRADQLTKDDKVKINTNQYSEDSVNFNTDKAWMLGFILCDGCYQNMHMFSSIGYKDEDDIAEHFSDVVKKYYDLEVNIVSQHRGHKGTYKDLCVKPDSYGTLHTLINDLTKSFEGINKVNRHIPNEVFSWNREAKVSFMAGMIDADGYLNNTRDNKSVVQIGSINKELALQQMALAQSLGMPAKMYLNYYCANQSKVRYRVEFIATEELVQALVCVKKQNKFVKYDKQIDRNEIANVVAVDYICCDDMYSYDVTTASEHFDVSGIWSHNCRSFLTPDRFSEKLHENLSKAKDWEDGKHRYYGRFNQGVVTINLPYVAMQSSGDLDEFWKIFEDALELCHRALRLRHENLLGTTSDVAPIMWQYGALARLEKGEVIDKLLYDGYSTISLGYAGLYEAVRYLTGHSHTDPEGKPLALAIMQKMNDKCKEWKAEENIDYSLYGTPIESTTYKFAKALKAKFGVVPEVSDHDYITNSYHVNVREEIDAFKKLEFEAEFQALSPGGAISYVEVPNMQDNIPAVMQIVRFIHENILYAELNTKSDYCQVCGYDGEIQVIKENGKYVWECPHCHNRDQHKMNVARRTCG